MIYNGTLFKVGNYTFPLHYIEADTYEVTKNVLDVDSYRDGNGVLHRNAMEHFSISVSFGTIPYLKADQIENLMSNLRTQYIDSVEKKVNIIAYVPELGRYVTQEAYMVDPHFKIKTIDESTIKYDRMTFEFIGY